MNKAINKMVPLNSTNIHEGLDLGLETLANNEDNSRYPHFWHLPILL